MVALMVAGHGLPASAEVLAQHSAGRRNVEVSELVAETLDRMQWDNLLQGRILRVSDWVICPDGFAFRVPEGMQANTSTRGKSIILEDQTGADDAFHNVISIVVLDEKDSLENLTAEKVRSAHLSQNFQRFELLSFEQEELYGAEGICYSYLTGSAPQLLVQQQMFDHNGQRYMITMTVENRISNVCRGLGQMASFRDSLLFCETPEQAVRAKK